MNDTEEVARRLFAVATENVPAGIDLMRGVRAGRRARAVRAQALAGVGAAAMVALVAAITLSAAPAPSAFAQVTHAAARTAEASYTVRSEQKIIQVGGLRSTPWATGYGEFDPVTGAGEFTDNLGGQIRWVGGSTYALLTGDLRASYQQSGPPIPPWASWEELPGIPLQQGGAPAMLGLLSVLPGFLGSVNPQGLLALLQSATDVRETGPASGPGWTGTAYSFTVAGRLNGPLLTAVGLSGTVDVDQQGRVRELDGRDSFLGTVSQIMIAFGGFGLPVSVSPPPASQTWIPPGA
ncbi:MAG: hypothetical protein ACRDOA_14655 [Streptosporangiaceae bacterium]